MGGRAWPRLTAGLWPFYALSGVLFDGQYLPDVDVSALGVGSAAG